MRVRFDVSLHPVAPVDGGGVGSLRDGHEYAVVEVGMDPERRVWLRIENEDGTPALYDSRCFVEVDGAVPAGWRATLRGGSITIGPAELRVPGFWERYFDGESAAVATYRASQHRR